MALEGSPVQTWYEVAPVNTERMREVLHPDVVFDVCPGWPNGGVFHGAEAVLSDFFSGAGKAWERIKPEMHEVIEVGDTYVVRGHYVGIAAGTQIPFDAQFVHIWRVKDGQLISLHQIADTAILADAMAGRETASPR